MHNCTSIFYQLPIIIVKSTFKGGCYTRRHKCVIRLMLQSKVVILLTIEYREDFAIEIFLLGRIFYREDFFTGRIFYREA